jgi:hypothetical protein
MKLSKIEEQINKKSNHLAASVGFLGVGMSALMATKGLQALSLCFIAIPLTIDIFTLKHLNNESKNHKYGLTLYKPFFHFGMKNWIKKYINKSDDIHEKKYKYIFLSVWLNHKKIDFSDLVFSSSDLFTDFKKELREQNLFNYELESLSNEYILSGDKYRRIDAILEEDKKYPKRLEIARKVYEEYAETGMAGKALTKDREFELFAFLQDYKFTSTDYEFIDSYKIIESSHPQLFQRNIEEYTENTKKALKLIVEKEGEISKLNILWNFFNKRILNADEMIDKLDSMKEIRHVIENKISYIELSNEMNTQTTIKKRTNKI